MKFLSEIDGTTAAFTGAVTVGDEAYGIAWDGSFQVPTKNALYDKFEGFGADFVTIGTTQTITAAKTFSGIVNFTGFLTTFENVLASEVATSRIEVQNNNQTALPSGNSTTGYIVGDLINGQFAYGFVRAAVGNGGTFSATDIGFLNFKDITDQRDYLFPDASGTIALTSDIPAPLTVVDGFLSTSTTEAGSANNDRLLDIKTDRNEFLGTGVSGIFMSRAIANMEDLSTLGVGNTLVFLENTTDAKNYLVFYDSTSPTQSDIDINFLYLRAIRTNTSIYDERIVARTAGNAKVCDISGSYTYVELVDFQNAGPVVNNGTLRISYFRENISIAALLSGGTFTGDISVPDEAYSASWNASFEVPTKNAIYDKIESLAGATWGAITGTLSNQTDLQAALDAKGGLSTENTWTGRNTFSDTHTYIDGYLQMPVIAGANKSNGYSNLSFATGSNLRVTGSALNNRYILDGVAITAERTFSLPDKSGTVAMLDDIATGFVDLTTNQSIGGVKTFTNSPVIATSGNSYLNFKNSTVTGYGPSPGNGAIYFKDNLFRIATTTGASGNTNNFGLDTGALTVNRDLIITDNDITYNGTSLLTEGSGTAVWGGITGTLSNQTDLQSALDAKLNLTGGTVTGPIDLANGASIESTASGSSFSLVSPTLNRRVEQVWVTNDIYHLASFTGSTAPGNPGILAVDFSTGVWSIGADPILLSVDIADINATGTADATTYLRGDGSWQTIAAGGGTWGSITGTLSNQTDLQTALDNRLLNTTDTLTGDLTVTGQGSFDTIDVTGGSNGIDLRNQSWLNFFNVDNTDRIRFNHSTTAGQLDLYHQTGTAFAKLKLGSLEATGTVEGTLIQNTTSGNGTPFRVVGTGVGTASIEAIGFYESNNSTRQGYIGFGSNVNSHLYINNDVSSKQLILQDTGVLTYDNQTVWHAGNDGSGSGLDSDLLDGQQGTYYDHRAYTVQNNYLGGGYVSGGLEIPTYFGAGRLKLQMLAGSNIGAPDTWNDVLWMSSYTGGDVKTSNALIFGKSGGATIGFVQQNYDSATWGTYREIFHSGNMGSGSGLDADTLDGVQATQFLRNSIDQVFSGGNLDFTNATRWQVSSGDTAHQRADARDDATTGARLHWYGVTDTGGTTNFRHAWYDGSNYVNVDYLSDTLTFGTTTVPFTMHLKSQVDCNFIVEADVGNSGETDNPTIELRQDGALVSTTWGISGGTNVPFTGAIDNSPYWNTLVGTGYVWGISNTAALTLTSGTLELGNSVNLDFGGTGGVLVHNETNSRDKLRVWSSGTYSIGMGTAYTFGGLGGYAMTFQMSNDIERGWWWGDTSHSNTQGAMSLTTEGKLGLAHSLRVGYGESDTTTPGATYKLDVGGLVFTTGNITANSDRRLKTNIKPIENALEKIHQLDGCTWDRTDMELSQAGFIAQDIQKVLPIAVNTAEDEMGTLSVDQGNAMTALLLQAVKELTSRVKELEKQINNG